VVEPWRHPDEGGEITPEMVALQAKAEEVFLTIVTRFNAEDCSVSPSKKGNYAPRIFADEPEAKQDGITQAYLEAAMRRLIKDKRVHCGKEATKNGNKRDRLEVVGGY
jgi:hypothetical protein